MKNKNKLNQYFEWDVEKNRKNLLKHKLDFSIAVEVFDDPSCFFELDTSIDYEERYRAIGTIRNQMIALVVHTIKFAEDIEIIRLISARKADKTEVKKYERRFKYR